MGFSLFEVFPLHTGEVCGGREFSMAAAIFSSGNLMRSEFVTLPSGGG